MGKYLNKIQGRQGILAEYLDKSHAIYRVLRSGEGTRERVERKGMGWRTGDRLKEGKKERDGRQTLVGTKKPNINSATQQISNQKYLEEIRTTVLNDISHYSSSSAPWRLL